MSLNSISEKAQISNNVNIGDFTVINDDVEIGNNVEIASNVFIDNGARISDNVKIHHGAVVSSIPQDLKFEGEETTLELGEGTVIREYVTLNRGTKESNKTVIGKNCFIMSYGHVAHDCRLGDNVIISNAVNMGGHVEIDDWAIVGGIVAIHQFVKIGKHSLIGGGFRAVKDIPPYIVAGNFPLRFEGLNLIGLRRRGFSNEKIRNIGKVYEVVYKSGLNVSDAVKKINDDFEMDDDVKTIVDFIEASNRGLIPG
jgi:UDP-N-acetylglucosamine acyltransferase